MRHMTTMIVLLIFPGRAILAETDATTDFFVSPTGNDANPGTEERPFATLARGKLAVRQCIAAGLGADVRVIIRAGTYRILSPLRFGPEDSGTRQHAISYEAYPGEKVVISGGKSMGGWQHEKGPIWEARVPDAAIGRWRFRNLFVNGRRAIRARSPNLDAEPNCRQLTAVEFTRDPPRYVLSLDPGLLGNWRNPSDVEVMIAGNWAINRKRVLFIDAGKNSVVLKPPHQHGPGYIFPSAGRWCHFENARELLDEPGEWYLDRLGGVLSYWPRAGEDMTRDDAVAPVLSQLLVVSGTSSRPVQNLHFQRLRFEHTDWELPPQGYMGIQACHYGADGHPLRRWKHIPAAIQLEYAQRCSVRDCVVSLLGGSGLELADGCRENVIEGNDVFDVSANGVMVGGPRSEAEVPKNNRVGNNHVHDCGREFYGAVGVWVGFAQRAVVAHNCVHDLPYTGISVGWAWSEEPSPCKENLIENNHVHDVMNRLCDGGCLYTLGFQPGTVIRGNVLHDVHRSPLAQGAPNNGIFIDKGSKGYHFERNVIYAVHAQPVRFNESRRDWHTWTENYLDNAPATNTGREDVIANAGLQPAYRGRRARGESANE